MPGGCLDQMELRLNSASVEVEVEAELGNNNRLVNQVVANYTEI